ncbi:MAG: NAD-dependent epimerase/dehydratase family protein [Pseudomonadota bacterium]
MTETIISVIGGAGFVGTNLCQRLSDNGIAFEIIDLRTSKRFPDHSKIGDVRKLDDLRATVTGTVVVNLAAVHRDDVTDRAEYYDTNVKGAENTVALCTERAIRRIVFTSTVAVYGFVHQETGEDGKTDPFNDYGRSKLEAEKVFDVWGTDPQNTLTVVRPTVIFGEGNRGNVYNLFNQINSGRFLMIGDGQNRKSLAYIGNVVAFLEECLVGARHENLTCNYVDMPNLDMNTLVSQVRGTLKGRTSVGLRLPRHVGLVLGHLADGVAKLSGRKLPISAIRVEKFTATTAFKSNTATMADFKRPFALEEGIERTLQSEFITPDPAREVFFTE